MDPAKPNMYKYTANPALRSDRAQLCISVKG